MHPPDGLPEVSASAPKPAHPFCPPEVHPEFENCPDVLPWMLPPKMFTPVAPVAHPELEE
jgi:hypothetical protein